MDPGSCGKTIGKSREQAEGLIFYREDGVVGRGCDYKKVIDGAAAWLGQKCVTFDLEVVSWSPVLS